MTRPALRTARCAAAALLGLAAFSAAAQGTVLRYTEPSVNRGERASQMNWFADEIARRTDGALKVNFFWGGALMEARAGLKGIGDGAAEMGSIVGSYTAREMQPYNVGDLPIVDADLWVGMRAMHELASTDPDIQKAFRQANVVYLSNYTTTEVQLICKNKVISRIEDFKGTKIRSAGFYGQVMESLGANVQRFSGMDANRALDTGNIQCNHNYLYGMRLLKDYEVANEIIRLDWGQHLAWAMVMNKDVFDKLPPAHQKVLKDTGRELVDRVARELMNANDRAVEAMKAGIDGHKVNVHPFPPAEKAKLMKAGEKFVDEWRTKTDAAGYDSKRILASYRALVDKYEQERKAKGYPWAR
jgi:TRAP-type C4-dicarboxylate transport system substrate-binding protein